VLSESKRRLRRSKQSERDLGHWLLKYDGHDPRFRGIASSTGRVGHITQLQFDNISRSYAAENKQVRVPVRLLKWWRQILDVAITQGKDALLRIEPTNEGLPRGRSFDLHIISADRHAELLSYERKVLDSQGRL
jgi:hypothetical protein